MPVILNAPTIYIIIPVFNRLHFTVRCLASLQQQDYHNCCTIVVDDGSTDGTAEYLRQHFSDVIVLRGDGNLWWTGAINQGVQKAMELSCNEHDFVLTLNNDLEVKPAYISTLLAASMQHPAALVGSVSVNIDRPEEVHFAGTKWNAATAKYRPACKERYSYAQLVNKFDIIATDLLPGRGVLIPFAVFKAIGLYDEAAFPHYMADEDFSLRAKINGFDLLIAVKAVVYNHVGETGLRKQRRNWRYYKDLFTSIKSPVNYSNRWNWARKHGRFPAAYFVMDMARIVKGVLSNA